MKAVAGLALLIGGMLVLAEESRADDLAQPGTRWVGNKKTADPKDKKKNRGEIKYSSTEFVLIIKERDGKKFKGETRQGKEKDQRVKTVEGTISEKGVADFRVTERLKGATADDNVDNFRHHGTFKDDQYIGKFTVPGNDLRWGEINLTLEKPDK